MNGADNDNERADFEMALSIDGELRHESDAEGDLAKQPAGDALPQDEVLSRYERSGYRLDVHPGHVIRRAHQKATLRFQQVMAGEDLSPTQFAALATILKHGEVSQNHLGRLTAMDPSTISIVVRKLLKHGLIRSGASETDQRLSLITMTEKGKRFTLDRLERSVEVGRKLLAPLSPAEQDMLLALLKRISDDD